MSAYVPETLRRRIREQFADRCAYCQTAETLVAATFEIEHILPRSAGGATTVENLCLACPTCNRHKASRQTAVAPLLGQPVPLFHPQRQRWEEHFTWSVDATVLHELTATGQATIAALRMNRPTLVRLRAMWVRMGEHPPRMA